MSILNHLKVEPNRNRDFNTKYVFFIDVDSGRLSVIYSDTDDLNKLSRRALFLAQRFIDKIMGITNLLSEAKSAKSLEYSIEARYFLAVQSNPRTYVAIDTEVTIRKDSVEIELSPDPLENMGLPPEVCVRISRCGKHVTTYWLRGGVLDALKALIQTSKAICSICRNT